MVEEAILADFAFKDVAAEDLSVRVVFVPVPDLAVDGLAALFVLRCCCCELTLIPAFGFEVEELALFDALLVVAAFLEQDLPAPT